MNGIMKRATSLMPLLLLALAQPGAAQIRASEDARVEQVVDGTRMSVSYSRPRIRGRDTIFGQQVKWNAVWTPGANWATKFRTTKPIRVNGHELPAGTYSVWFQIRESGPWTVLFDGDSARTHVQHAKPDSAVVKFDVLPRTGPHREALTWSFTDYTHEGATLEMAWDSIRVPMDIMVTPSQRLHATADEAAPVRGRYAMQWTMQRNQPAQQGTLDVTWRPEDSTLRAHATFPQGDPWQLVLAPRADGVFVAIFTNEGEIWSTAESYLFEFAIEGERANTVQLRLGSNDRLLGTGTRAP